MEPLALHLIVLAATEKPKKMIDYAESFEALAQPVSSPLVQAASDPTNDYQQADYGQTSSCSHDRRPFTAIADTLRGTNPPGWRRKRDFYS